MINPESCLKMISGNLICQDKNMSIKTRDGLHLYVVAITAIAHYLMILFCLLIYLYLKSTLIVLHILHI